MDTNKLDYPALLSSRELQILQFVVKGLSNQKIAHQLEISKRTVDNHISNILKKTNSDNRVELVRWSLQWGKACLDNVNCCSIPKIHAERSRDLAESNFS